MADLIVTETGTVHRPRNVDWKRAAALLYGDWGTSKAYVLGLAFLAAGFSSLPIILAQASESLLHLIDTIFLARIGVVELGAPRGRRRQDVSARARYGLVLRREATVRIERSYDAGR